MQKLVWENSNGERINLTDGDFGITNWEGFSNAPLNIQSQQVPMQDGSVFLDALIENRELSVTLAIQDNNDLEKRYQYKRQLIHALNPKLGEGYLYYTNDYISKRIKCVPQLPLFPNKNSNDSGTQKASLSWTACEPYWEDTEEKEIVLKSGEQTIITNSGDVDVNLKIELLANLNKPYLINNTNQKRLRLDNSYSENVYIDTNKGKKRIYKYKKQLQWYKGGNFNSVAAMNNRLVYSNTEIGLLCQDIILNQFYETDVTDKQYLNVIAIKEKECYLASRQFFSYKSIDGLTWESGSGGGAQAIFAKNNYYSVAPTRIYKSIDGLTWEEKYYNSDVRLESICYSEEKDLFVAVGRMYSNDYSCVLISSDGETWVLTNPDRNRKYKITYGKGLFIATEIQGGLSKSEDGQTWTQCNTPYMNTNVIKGVYYSDKMELFLIWKDEGIAYSSDGETWVLINNTNAIGNYLKDVQYDETQQLFIGVGSNGMIVNSYDGVVWNVLADYEFVLYFKKLLKAKGIYFAFTSNNYVWVSDNKTRWDIKSNFAQINTIINDICYSEEKDLFVAVGNNGVIYVSSDGETWTFLQNITQKNINSIIYENGKFYACGSEGLYLTSNDGSEWVVSTINVSYNLKSIILTLNKTPLFVGENGAIFLDRSWKNSGTNENLNSISYFKTKNLYITVGNNGVYSISNNGTNWTKKILTISGITIGTLRKVICDEEKILVICDNYLLTSSDGNNWNVLLNYNCIDILDEENEILYCGNNKLIAGIKLSEEINLIQDLESYSDMSFDIEVGDNVLNYYNGGNDSCLIKYRQKYIGV